MTTSVTTEFERAWTRWNTDRESLELQALDRGIESLDMLVASARPFYLLARYNPTLVGLTVMRPCS